jgi:UDP-N-acetylmuramoyl-L-alanyl-D-glutamate--2,6-diaminopimelate ligase
MSERGPGEPVTMRTGTTLARLGAELGASLGGAVVGDAEVAVTAMTHDSRRATPGTLYACVRGERNDGHEFAPAAVAAGASALLVDHRLELDVPQLVVGDTRTAMGPVAAAVYGHPSQAMTVVGITGTNGKTTSTHLLASILRRAGHRTGLIGTLSGTHTTPEAPELQARLAAFRDEGCTAVVMEVSSHALALHRVDGTRFAVAVFTNLGRDHLDLHGSAQAYFRAKARLFTPELAALGVTNIDDAHGRLLRDAAPIPIVPFSALDATDVEVTASTHAFTWRGERVTVGLGGSFNVMNSLAAATAAAVLDIAPATIAAGLQEATPVPGRFERLEPPGGGNGVIAVVDYAHTPDGLEQVLTAAREISRGRVLLVFGCGGDRDHAKRPRMGAVAARLADRVVVTSDNPRSEAPAAIIADVVAGVPPNGRALVSVEPDRAAAIALALDAAADGDVLVVAGKGHETTQTIGDRVTEFDDRVVVRRLMEDRDTRRRTTRDRPDQPPGARIEPAG